MYHMPQCICLACRSAAPQRWTAFCVDGAAAPPHRRETFCDWLVGVMSDETLSAPYALHCPPQPPPNLQVALKAAVRRLMQRVGRYVSEGANPPTESVLLLTRTVAPGPRRTCLVMPHKLDILIVE